MYNADFLIVGGGIVGLSVAHFLASKGKVIVLEKESGLACHQSGRNSGVVHSGIYYKPGSAKALFCRNGQAQLREFCEKNSIPCLSVGKVIVAQNALEVAGLENLEERAKGNGIEAKLIGPRRLQELEPNAVGVAALHVPETAIVDYRQVCHCLGSSLEVHRQSELISANAGYAGVKTPGAKFSTAYCYKYIINCAGLYADRVAQKCGLNTDAMIVPFRGEYYEMDRRGHHLVNGLVYPVPDPSFPFLGVHFTKMVGGGVECGPNAVLALGRECYTHGFQLGDVVEMLRHAGLRSFLSKHWRVGLREVLRSFSKSLYLRDLRKLVPGVKREWLHPRPAGIRAQAMGADGKLLDDFVIVRGPDSIHVLNAPSPAATACLAIGKHVAEKLESS